MARTTRYKDGIPQADDPQEGAFFRDLLGSFGGGALFGVIMGGLIVFVVEIVWFGVPPSWLSFFLTMLICGLILGGFYAMGAVIRQAKN